MIRPSEDSSANLSPMTVMLILVVAVVGILCVLNWCHVNDVNGYGSHPETVLYPAQATARAQQDQAKAQKRTAEALERLQAASSTPPAEKH